MHYLCAMAVPGYISRYFDALSVPTPHLIVVLEKVESKYRELVKAFPEGKHHYAIKANPHPDILQRLHSLGCSFECASINEIRICLASNIHPDDILYGNPIKKVSEIIESYAKGIRQFVFDSEMELEKLAMHAPGSKVLCRIITDGSGALSPLSIKFGCPKEKAIVWMQKARTLGLVPHGISFHTGSQQLQPSSWEAPVRDAAEIFNALAGKTIDTMQVLDIGGGFPVNYRNRVPCIKDFGKAINRYVKNYFDGNPPFIYTEPGRYMVADAGYIQAEVVLISPDHKDSNYRWVYLDIGRYGGLVEEKIDYPILCHRRGKTGLVILAGQTCDSNDVIYPKEFCYQLPEKLRPGDRVILAHAGAYTTTYSTTLNGFERLSTTCVSTVDDKTSRGAIIQNAAKNIFERIESANLDYFCNFQKPSAETTNRARKRQLTNQYSNSRFE